VPAFVVGSAGHIDHGKTSLIRALTGVDLDALPEEKERGITIALGFTAKVLPSGRRLSFVDVPGHERLVRTMISGAVGFDAVLFCVSANEGVMPQTQEHLAILNLLGIEHGIIAMTHADCVEDELAELAVEEVREAVSGSFLEDAPIVLTSATTGQGVSELEAALEALPQQNRDTVGPYRLAVDRCFVQKGFGSVVTGTSQSGAIAVGDELQLLPLGKKVRVRGLEVHGESREKAYAGERTAVNLAGVDAEEITRGCVLASLNSLEAHAILDVHYRHLTQAPPLENLDRVRLLLGTSEVLAVVEKITDTAPDQSDPPNWIQLRCEKKITAQPGDRFVLRRESPLTTLGGGQVVDPWAIRLRKGDRSERVALLQRMKNGDDSARIESAGLSGLDSEAARNRLAAAAKPEDWLGDRLVGAPQVQALSKALLSGLAQAHSALPLSPGIPRRSLQKGVLMALSSAAVDGLIARLAHAGKLCLDGALVRLPDWQVNLSAKDAQAAESLVAGLTHGALDPPKLEDLKWPCTDPDALIALLVSQGRLVRISGRVYAEDALAALKISVCALLVEKGEMAPAQFKALTGLSRKNAIPLLEYLDQVGLTKRVGDVRVAATSDSR
jgi:selenocysteine-specific elongation factor